MQPIRIMFYLTTETFTHSSILYLESKYKFKRAEILPLYIPK